MQRQAVRNGVAVAVAALVIGVVVVTYTGRTGKSVVITPPASSTITPTSGHAVHQNAGRPAQPPVAAENIFAGGYSQDKYLRLKTLYKRHDPSASGPLTGRHLEGAIRTLTADLHGRKIPPIVQAIYDGRSEVVEEALGEGLSPDTVLYLDVYNFDYNSTLLDFAIDTGRRDIVKLLLEHGASPNPLQSKQPDGEPDQYQAPLPFAAQLGEDDVVELLLKYGADINQTSNIPGMDQTALWGAVTMANVSTAYLLLMHGANMSSALGPDGQIPLEYTLPTDRPNLLAMRQLLLAHGGILVPNRGPSSPVGK